MTKKSYVAYSVSMLLCILLGMWVAIGCLLLFDSFPYAYGVFLIGNVFCVLPFVIVGILSFFYTKKVLLARGKKAFAPIFLWNFVVVALSATYCLLGNRRVWDILLVVVLAYMVPCVLSSVASIVIYSRKIHWEEGADTPIRKQAILSQFSLFFVPAILLVLLDSVTAIITHGDFFVLYAGIQIIFLLIVTFASCVYARGAVKRLGKFPLENLIANFVFSMIFSLSLYFYAKILTQRGHSIWLMDFGAEYIIVMILIPPICFSISAAISVACDKRKARKQSAVNAAKEPQKPFEA